MQRLVFLTIGVLCQIAPAQEKSPEILGRWYTVERSNGGIGAMIEFLPVGTVKYGPGAIVLFTYTFDAQKVTLKFVDPDKGPQPDSIMTVLKLSADKMTLQRDNAPAEELVRAGNPEDRGRLLLGNWIAAPRDMGGKKMSSNWRFRADGSGVFTLPFSESAGQYELMKNVIRLNVGNAISVEGPISWEGDILVLPGKRSPTKLHRF